jgi:hypothetical protein
MAVCTKRTEALEGVYGVSGRRVCDAEISSFTTQFYKLICVVIDLFIGQGCCGGIGGAVCRLFCGFFGVRVGRSLFFRIL